MPSGAARAARGGRARRADDFGTGYSSLAYLRAFPFHTLKIDRFSSTRWASSPMPTPSDTIVHTARAPRDAHRGRRGREDDIQLAAVRKMRCDEVQGYLIRGPCRWTASKAGSQAGWQATGDNVDSRLMPWWSQSALASFLDEPIGVREPPLRGQLGRR